MMDTLRLTCRRKKQYRPATDFEPTADVLKRYEKPDGPDGPVNGFAKARRRD